MRSHSLAFFAFLLGCGTDTFTSMPPDGAFDDVLVPDAGADADPLADGSEASVPDGDPSDVVTTADASDGGEPCTSEVLAGGTMTGNVSQQSGKAAGIVIQALKTTTLTGFVVNNQGNGATAQLLDDASSAVLEVLPVPSGKPAYAASVSWPLAAGKTYDLVIASADDGRDGAFLTYPASNASLSATGGYLGGPYASTWFVFTSIASCP